MESSLFLSSFSAIARLILLFSLVAISFLPLFILLFFTNSQREFHLGVFLRRTPVGSSLMATRPAARSAMALMVLATFGLAAAFVPPAPAALDPGLAGRAARLRACCWRSSNNLTIAQVLFLHQHTSLESRISPRAVACRLVRGYVMTSSPIKLHRLLDMHAGADT